MVTLKQLKGSEYRTVDFYLSKSCNKSCHYCTAWTLEMRYLHVDMDLVRTILKGLAPYKTRICLLGGEPGLIKNLDEIIAEIKKYPNLISKVNDMIDLGYKSAKISRELNIKYVIILEYKNFYNHLKIFGV